MYTAHGLRPDIAFAVQQLSEFNQTFTNVHWTAAKRFLRYLKGTPKLGIIFHPSFDPPSLTIYTDADFANLPDAKSIGGYVVMYGTVPLHGVLKSNLESPYQQLNWNI